MDVVYPRCCGLDLHKAKIVACVLVPGAAGRPAKEIRTFGTMTADLLELGEWLEGQAVTHVAMESTGVYWKPIWNVLEDRFEVFGVVLPAADGALVDGLCHILVRGRADHFFAGMFVELQHSLVPWQTEEFQDLAGLAL